MTLVSPYCVVVDANVWVTERLLQAESAIAKFENVIATDAAKRAAK
jgi:hypothetical protein